MVFRVRPLFNDAVNFLGRMAANRGHILFVGTKRAAQEIVSREAQRCAMPYVDRRWLGGMLTNFRTVRDSIRRLKDLETMVTDGSLNRLSKKEGLSRQRELDKLENMIRTSPELMEALAARYLGMGGTTDLLRALTLLRLISRESVVTRYSEPWWNRQLLTIRCWDQLFEDFEIHQAAENIQARLRQWEILGVLDRSPVKEELAAIGKKHAE